MRGTELLAGIGAPVLAAQPLAVDEMGAGDWQPDAGATQAVERAAVQALGAIDLAEQRAPVGLDAERPVAAASARAVKELLKGAGCLLRDAAPGRSLNQLDRGPQ